MHDERVIEPHARAVAPARRWADDRLVEAGVDASRRQVVVLLVSEVVTNAVRHARPPVRLLVEVDDERVRVEARDGYSAPPVLKHARPQDDGGRGVWLVDRLASDWGMRAHDDGKTVWFEVRHDDERSEAPALSA
ncbi:ATP-binding protein [Cellulomonas sp. HZM]|uniref:ATP-binding protein n=1 Tax=Cellulomonas sp. HZM TaxID=1454010 RepID=UPI0004932B7B|nr:ATP-binding protein [Cellulomonas sp. HZM]